MMLAAGFDQFTRDVLLSLILLASVAFPLFKIWIDGIKHKRNTALMEKLIIGYTQLTQQFATLSTKIVEAFLRRF